jgi:2-succinyl-5-enolpyruvyl-6-hydroxy-3-cyclohexene-1-carboxylate synthase
MTKHYTDELNTLVLISLLKLHGIRRVVASPGTTNVAFVGSIQGDQYFNVISSVDERSAAYLACGLAHETGEPVVISCTGATAFRNYLSGMTEAYYRKLPVLVVTSTQVISKIGHNMAQVIDGRRIPDDVAKLTLTLPVVKDKDDFWDCEVKVNQAILELNRFGAGPVHLNLPTLYHQSFNIKELPECRMIKRYETTQLADFPILGGKVAVLVGSHRHFSEVETYLLDKFCESYNAVVFCDHTSSYRGKYRVLYALAATQEMLDLSDQQPDITIHIGEVTGDYESLAMVGKKVWRVSPDGELRDTFRRLTNIFQMEESDFFKTYSEMEPARPTVFFDECQDVLQDLRSRIPDLPFSNIWLASRLANIIPAGAAIHFGILNSLRSWNFFELPSTVTSTSNVGGFGIDGGLSSLIGASLANEDKLYFGVIGDLAFFYDINVLGNRHVGSNVRILLVNNGKGTEFRQYNHKVAHFGDDADRYISAAGHFGCKSSQLVRHFSEDLGYAYISASNKQEFELVFEQFINPHSNGKSIVFEVFTDSVEESNALEAIRNLKGDSSKIAKRFVKNLIGDKSIKALRSIFGE